MDPGLAQRLSKHEKYQFLALEGNDRPRPNQIRNYAALKIRGEGSSSKRKTNCIKKKGTIRT